MPSINATLINLYHVCPRECWLHTNGINMEQTSDMVYDGKLLHETSYPQRAEKYTEISLSATMFEGISLSGKMDFYDSKEKVIHETKRGNTVEEAHEWQVKFYIWLLDLNGIAGASAILEYPKLRQTTHVSLTEKDREYLQTTIHKIADLIEDETCPPKAKIKFCKSCSYHDFCWIEE